MRVTLLLVFLFCTTLTFSQAYKPMLKENKTWGVLEDNFNGTPHTIDIDKYILSGTTTVDGKTYHQIQKYDRLSGNSPSNYLPPLFQNTYSFTNMLIREDTATRKIYGRYTTPSITGLDSIETIIYDFSLNPGDTLCSYIWNESYIIVDSLFNVVEVNCRRAIIDSIGTTILDNGQSTSVFYYTPIDFESNDKELLEGVSGRNGFFKPFVEEFEFRSAVLCVLDNGTQLITANWYSSASCGDFVEITEVNQDKLTIHPNPVTRDLVITSDEILTTPYLTLHNSLGQQVLSEQYPTSNEFKLALDVPSGIYFLRIGSGDKVIAKKIVKQ